MPLLLPHRLQLTLRWLGVGLISDGCAMAYERIAGFANRSRSHFRSVRLLRSFRGGRVWRFGVHNAR